MKILLAILFELLEHRRMTAEELAQTYGISTRTVYRCVERLSPFLPLHVRRGRSGGICLSDSYKLPVGFLSDREYNAAVDALTNAYSADPREEFLTAKRKLTASQKQTKAFSGAWLNAGELLLLPTPNENERQKTEREILQLLQTGIREKRVVRVLCNPENSFSESPSPTVHVPLPNIENRTPRTPLSPTASALPSTVEYAVEPHFLTLQGERWSLCGFCHTRRKFVLLPLQTLQGVLLTEETFRPRPVRFDELHFSD